MKRWFNSVFIFSFGTSFAMAEVKYRFLKGAKGQKNVELKNLKQ